MIYFALAFKEIDTEDKGYITKDDLNNYSENSHAPKSFEKQFLQIFDQNHKGSITFEEYCNILGLKVPTKEKMDQIDYGHDPHGAWSRSNGEFLVMSKSTSINKKTSSFNQLNQDHMFNFNEASVNSPPVLSSDQPTITTKYPLVEVPIRITGDSERRNSDGNLKSNYMRSYSIERETKNSKSPWQYATPRNTTGYSTLNGRSAFVHPSASKEQMNMSQGVQLRVKETYQKTADNKVISKIKIPPLATYSRIRSPVREREYLIDSNIRDSSSRHRSRSRRYEQPPADYYRVKSISRERDHASPREPRYRHHSDHYSHHHHRQHRSIDPSRNFLRRSGGISQRAYSSQRLGYATMPRYGTLPVGEFAPPLICQKCQEGIEICAHCQRTMPIQVEPQQYVPSQFVVLTPTLANRQALFTGQQALWNSGISTMPAAGPIMPPVMNNTFQRHCVCCPYGEHQHSLYKQQIDVHQDHENYVSDQPIKRPNLPPVGWNAKRSGLRNTIEHFNTKSQNIPYSPDAQRSTSDVIELHQIEDSTQINALHAKQTVMDSAWVDQQEEKDFYAEIRREDGFPLDYEDFFSAGDESQMDALGEFEEEKQTLTIDEKLMIIHMLTRILQPGIQNFQVAKELKSELDITFDKEWQVVAGRGAYGSHFACVKGFFFHFKAFGWLFLLWKTR